MTNLLKKFYLFKIKLAVRLAAIEADKNKLHYCLSFYNWSESYCKASDFDMKVFKENINAFFDNL